jgi:hypothetical protein
VDGSYGVRALDADRNARLMSITDKATWIIEGVYYRWLRPSFERADMIFVGYVPTSLYATGVS